MQQQAYDPQLAPMQAYPMVPQQQVVQVQQVYPQQQMVPMQQMLPQQQFQQQQLMPQQQYQPQQYQPQPVPSQQYQPQQMPSQQYQQQIVPQQQMQGQPQPQQAPGNAVMPSEFIIKLKDKKSMFSNREPYFEVTTPESICAFPFINKVQFEADVLQYATQVAKPVMKKFKCLFAMYIPLLISLVIWIVLSILLFLFGAAPGVISTVIMVVSYLIIGICIMVTYFDALRTFKRQASDPNAEYLKKYESLFKNYGYETFVAMGLFTFMKMKIRRIK